MLKGHIHSTESFGTVDGPGIRFVVFFQGCPMRCLYCHNPDTWPLKGGREVTAEELLTEYDGVKEFLKNGGLTCTGGEPLLQLEFLTELFEKAHERGIHTCLDTSGIAYDPARAPAFERLLGSTDLVMLDIKHIDNEKHKALTGHPNARILDFASFVTDRGTPMWIRHVLVPGLNDDEESLKALGAFMADLRTVKALDVLPYHTMGRPKYEALGLDYPLGDTPAATTEQATRARRLITQGLREEFARRKRPEG